MSKVELMPFLNRDGEQLLINPANVAAIVKRYTGTEIVTSGHTFFVEEHIAKVAEKLGFFFYLGEPE